MVLDSWFGFGWFGFGVEVRSLERFLHAFLISAVHD